MGSRNHFNGLSPSEAERLALVMEECAEVQQVVGKILRHGYDSKHPDGGMNNRQLLEREIGDLSLVLRLLEVTGDVQEDKISKYSEEKQERINKFLHHNKVYEEDEEDVGS